MLKRDTCSNKVKEIILKKDDHNTLEECNNLIERVKEFRHNSIMRRQKAKFEAFDTAKTGWPLKPGGSRQSSKQRYAGQQYRRYQEVG